MKAIRKYIYAPLAVILFPAVLSGCAESAETRRMLMREQAWWIIGAAAAMALMLAVMTVMYIRGRKKSRTILTQATELTATNARISMIIGNLPGMVYQHLNDSPNYTITFIGRGSEELTGYTPEELVGGPNKFMAMVHPDDLEGIAKKSAETLDLGLPWEHTYRIVMPDGSVKWIWDRMVVTEKGPDIASHVVDGYMFDVTEQKRLEAAEVEKTRMASRLEAIISNLPGMAYQCLYNSPEYTLTFVSEGSRDLLGYAPEDLVGGVNWYQEMLHPDDVPLIKRKCAETLDRGLLFEHTHRLVMKDGTIKWVMERSSVLERHPDGTPRLVEGYVFDITEQRRTETAELASRAKSNFLAKMSHEIRTPLNAILGITQMQMLKEGLPEETATGLEKIHSAGTSLLGIINNILDLSKIEMGKMELNPVEYDLPALVYDAVQLNMVRIGSKPVRLELHMDESLPSRLIGDELRLTQILNNLLSNAIKYTDRGVVKLSVYHLPQGEDVTLRFTVEDTGQGMRPEDCQKLFSEYLRLNVNANRAAEGAGLGLSITKSLVDMMEGAIKAESKFGQGSTFTVTVRQKAVKCVPLGAEVTKQLQSFTFSKDKARQQMQFTFEPMPYGKVLIVDDVRTNLYVAEVMLEPYHLNIETALSGFETIDKINSGHAYDIIFMDHMMPMMDGIETTQKLRGIGYDGPIIALTANALLGNDEMFRQHGFDGFISKPIDAGHLNATVNQFVRDRHRK